MNIISTEDFNVPLSTLDLPKIIMSSPEMPFLEAASLMFEKKIGSLVLGKEGKISGIFTERDIIKHADLVINEKKSIQLDKLMTPNPFTIKSDASLLDAISIMSSREFRHIPIVDNDGNVISIISIKDILKYLLSFFENFFSNFKPISYWSKESVNLQEVANLYDIEKSKGSLREDVLYTNLKRIGSSNFSFVSHTVTIEDVLHRLHQKSHSVALVTEYETELAGIVTERDLLFKVFSQDVDLSTSVTEIMTSNPHILSIENKLGHALKNMFTYHYRNIPLINTEGFPVSIVTLLDILIFIGNELGVRNVLQYL